jgi:hypothetical protein
MVHDDLQLVPAKLIKQRSSTLGLQLWVSILRLGMLLLVCDDLFFFFFIQT